MKSVSELTDFYYKVLYPTLNKLEKDRKHLRYRIILVGFALTFVFFLGSLALQNAFFLGLDFFAFVLFAYAGIGAFVYKILIKGYTDDFKSVIIHPLIKELDNRLSYTHLFHVAQHLFERSQLFQGRIDRISGNDFVNGEIDGVKIEFSDLHVERRHKDSRGRESWTTLFRGLFIVADFNKTFHGKTVVLPDSAQKTFGDLIGGWLQSKNLGRDELIKLDDVEFENKFVVYGTDQIEARYILSHSLMKRILAFKKKTKHPLYISFVGHAIHIAIEYNKDLFEPTVFSSLLDYKTAMEYVQTLHLAIGIIEELKLNQKLWSKR
ncbi:MAG: DUF3137 domain-containing protein [Sulfurimonas sp.]|nr:DUF3137 domain-containing protein [Sulfurimonas sp.]